MAPAPVPGSTGGGSEPPAQALGGPGGRLGPKHFRRLGRRAFQTTTRRSGPWEPWRI